MFLPSIFKIFPEGEITGLRRVKFGIDPTFPRLHLGHFVPLRIVRKLQREGHDVTIVLGTFTAQMGDPSGRDSTRPILSAEEVAKNAEVILEQVERILGPAESPKFGFEVFRNHTLHEAINAPTLLKHLSKFTLTHMLSRNGFEERQNKGNPIGMHELIVPVLQGLDSVWLNSEIEIGGQDQLFNFQIARKLQEDNGQKPQQCLMMPIINGTDGRKMSKSLGNCIFLDESAEDIFGKVMSISDETMEEWLPLFIDPVENIPFENTLPAHPMARKRMLAETIVAELHGIEIGRITAENFCKTVQNKELPKNIPEIEASNIIDAVVKIRKCSKTEARRLIDSKSVRIIDSLKNVVSDALESGDIIQVGKRDFGKVK